MGALEGGWELTTESPLAIATCALTRCARFAFGGNLELTVAALEGWMGRAALAGSTTRYGAGAFEVVAIREPGVVRKRATRLVVLGRRVDTTPLALGRTAEPSIGGMPGGRALGAGGGRKGVDAGYPFALRFSCMGVFLTSYTRTLSGPTRWGVGCQCKPSARGGLCKDCPDQKQPRE